MIDMIDIGNGRLDDPVSLAVLTCIEKGWPVFPLHRRILGEDGKSRCPCGNPNCKAKGKEPLTDHGYLDATTDEETTRAYFRKYPRCNIGIPTGEVSGLLVLDIDGPEGQKSLLALEEKYGALPATLTSATGRIEGGEHRFFRYPEASEIRSPKLGPEFPKIDVLGNGHYVVAPPSVHKSGKTYAWVDETAEIAELPQAWVEFLVKAQRRKETGKTVGKARGKTMNGEEEKIPKGSRNNRLHEIACSLVHKGKPKDFVLESVLAINDATCNPPLNEAEIREIVESAWNYRDQERAENLAERQLRLRLTDEGNAERLDQSKGDVLLWDKDQKRFLLYDGCVWSADDGELAQTLAREIIQNLEIEARNLEDPLDRKAMTEFAAKCQTPTRIKATLDIYKMDPSKLVSMEDFDTHPHLLNCLNGIVNLQTKELIPHDPALRLTYMAPFKYNPEAKCPLWIAFLQKVFQDDPDAIKSMQRQLGYFLTAEMREQKFFVWVGNGRNGKSTIRNVLSFILGDYLGDCSSSAFIVKRFNQEVYELADQAQKRLMFSAEITDTYQLDEPLIKAVTGGDKHTFRQIYGKPMRIYPKFKIIILCNRVPEIRGTDDGIWDRCNILQFKQKFEGKSRVQDYHKVLRVESEGILTWLVEAAAEWYREGLFVSAESDEMNAMLRKASDPLGQFLEESCAFGYGKKVGATLLYEEYRSWSEERKEPAMSQAKFGLELMARQIHGIKKIYLSGRYSYCGIGLKPDPLLSEVREEGDSDQASMPDFTF
jgi:putative DNA primase/helicase